MRGQERVMELLRPFVDTKAWDYCVIWKLGDDPSRFIEWVGCCCSGRANGNNIKVERGEEEEEHKSSSKCRDEHKQHPIRTKACEALSHFPLSMPLYSGIHGEVVMSKLPRWLLNHQSSGLDSKPPNETAGTQVLVPVFDGLIELFSARNIPADQKLVDMIASHCNVSLSANLSLNAQLLFDPMPEQTMQYLSTSTPGAQHYLNTSVTQSNSTSLNLSFDGSSSVSNPSNENPARVPYPSSFDQDFPLNQSCGDSGGSKRTRYREVLLNHEQEGLVLDYTNKDVIGRENGNKGNKSKNLFTERKRRNRIKHGLFTLRSLVPKITEMHKAATLGDAIDYIGELEGEVKKLQVELKQIDETENNEEVKEEKFAKPGGIYHISAPANHQNRISSGFSEKEITQVIVEVNQIGRRDFLIRVFCGYKRGGFQRLMETIDSLGLEIVDANVTTFNYTVMNIVNVKANKDGIPAGKLRDLLLVMITSKYHSVAGKSEKEGRN